VVGGGIAKKARRELEAKTGKKVVTGESFLPPEVNRTFPQKNNSKKKG
jgi:DNA-damage-inducible protein D